MHAWQIPEVLERTVVRPRAEALAQRMSLVSGRPVAIGDVTFDPRTGRGEIELVLPNTGLADVEAILAAAAPACRICASATHPAT